MVEWNPTDGEYFFLRVHHYFEFLRLEGYKGNEFRLDGRGEKFVTFYHPVKKKFITITEKSDGSLDFLIQSKGFLSKPKSYIEHTGIKITGIEQLSQVVRKNADFQNLVSS